MFKENRRLFVVSLITLIGSLGYGIVVPLLFVYSSKYGLSNFELGILFSTFSLCEFIATPIIGMLSDRYGRRPMLIFSLMGTTISFFMMAYAPSIIFLFIARALDGLTAGNIPVAQAVIADTTEEKDRTKGFGIIGACYGIGLIAGPAIAALTAHISLKLPFIVAGILSLIAFLGTSIFLHETNKHIGQIEHKKLFDWRKLFGSMFDTETGPTLIISFLWSCAFGMFIYTYQSFSLRIIHLSASGIAMTFLFFGIVSLITQVFIVSRLSKRLGNCMTIKIGLLCLAFSFLTFTITHSVTMLLIVIVAMGISSTLVQILIQTLLSERTSPQRQGEILGISASYASIGQIIGPVTAGSIVALGLGFSFILSALIIAIGLFVSMRIMPKKNY